MNRWVKWMGLVLFIVAGYTVYFFIWHIPVAATPEEAVDRYVAAWITRNERVARAYLSTASLERIDRIEPEIYSVLSRLGQKALPAWDTPDSLIAQRRNDEYEIPALFDTCGTENLTYTIGPIVRRDDDEDHASVTVSITNQRGGLTETVSTILWTVRQNGWKVDLATNKRWASSVASVT